MLPNLEQCGEISIGKEDFMIWGISDEVVKLDVIKKEGYQKLLHWAGGTAYFHKMPRKDIYLHYLSLYYKDLSIGNLYLYLELLRRYF